MFNCFIRFLTYSHVCSPVCGSMQSGPTQINMCRLSLPTPNCAAIVGGGSPCGLAIGCGSYTEQNCFFTVKNQLSDRGFGCLFAFDLTLLLSRPRVNLLPLGTA